MVEQAEYFLRIANAQESLAGDSASALTALELADDHLRGAGDPRLTPVRKLVATEIATLRALPQVDTEGLALRLDALSDALPELPRRQAARASFREAPAAPEPAASGLERATQALRNALLSIVSVRRTDAPSPTLLTEESAELLLRSLELELQMARIALLRSEPTLYRTSLAAARRNVEQYFDGDAPAVTAALATLDELERAPLPDSRPDVSAPLTALIKLRESAPVP
jgi:uroporphyrin-3 C-methyltransferase